VRLPRSHPSSARGAIGAGRRFVDRDTGRLPLIAYPPRGSANRSGVNVCGALRRPACSRRPALS